MDSIGQNRDKNRTQRENKGKFYAGHTLSGGIRLTTEPLKTAAAAGRRKFSAGRLSVFHNLAGNDVCLGKVAPGLLRVPKDLVAEGLQIVEAPLRPQTVEKLHLAGFTVKAQLLVQQVALHGNGAIDIHRGPHTHIGDGGKDFVVHFYPGGVHAVGRHQVAHISTYT